MSKPSLAILWRREERQCRWPHRFCIIKKIYIDGPSIYLSGPGWEYTCTECGAKERSFLPYTWAFVSWAEYVHRPTRSDWNKAIIRLNTESCMTASLHLYIPASHE